MDEHRVMKQPLFCAFDERFPLLPNIAMRWTQTPAIIRAQITRGSMFADKSLQNFNPPTGASAFGYLSAQTFTRVSLIPYVRSFENDNF